MHSVWQEPAPQVSSLLLLAEILSQRRFHVKHIS